jgi:hypothetical protein
MSIEFQFCIGKNSGDLLYNNMNKLETTEMYTLKMGKTVN